MQVTILILIVILIIIAVMYGSSVMGVFLDQDHPKRSFDSLSVGQKKLAVELAWNGYSISNASKSIGCFASLPLLVGGFFFLISLGVAEDSSDSGLALFFFLFGSFWAVLGVYGTLLGKLSALYREQVGRVLAELQQLGNEHLTQVYPGLLARGASVCLERLKSYAGNVEVETQTLVTSGDSVLGYWGECGKTPKEILSHLNELADLLEMPETGIHRKAAIIAVEFSVPKIPNDLNSESDSRRLFKHDQMITPTLYLGTNNSVIVVPKLDPETFKVVSTEKPKPIQTALSFILSPKQSIANMVISGAEKLVVKLMEVKPHINIKETVLRMCENPNAKELQAANFSSVSATEVYFTEMITIEYDGSQQNFGLSISTRDGRTLRIDGNPDVANWLREKVRASKQFSAPRPASQPTSQPAPAPQVISSDTHKVCPMCAEDVKLAAKICRYCRYEFEPIS